MVRIEIAVFNIESALNAQAAGADRIELCSNPAEGGTTPSFGIMDVVRRRVNLDVMVMVRPRGGDFCYSDAEYDSMKSDIMTAKRLGMDGVVFGILNQEGTIDEERCRELILLAKPMQVTCHRAFDRSPDPDAALEACVRAGFDRILTSGCATDAHAGRQTIKSLVEQAAGRILILPGAGIRSGNASELVEFTGAAEVHLSARVFRESSAEQHHSTIRFTEALPDDSGSYIADPNEIRKVRASLNGK